MRALLLLLVSCLLIVPLAAAPELRAGTARVDITPPLEMKVALGGYGDRMSRPATGVHDRVWAKVLALQQGTTRFAVVTADVLGFPTGFRGAVAAELGGDWKEAQLMLLPSHSHTSYDLSALNPKNTAGIPQIGIFHEASYRLLIQRIAQAVREAARETVPVSVGTASAPLPGWVRNRRAGGTVTDPELTVTRVDRRDGKPLAVLVNWAAHPTFMSSDDMEFSGDWPGYMQRTVEALFGDGTTVLYCNGAQGDQAPVARPDSGSSRWEKAERYGRELGIRAWQLAREVRTKPDAALEVSVEPVALPARTWHPDFMQTGGKEYGLTEPLLRRMLAEMFPATSHSATLRLGELRLVGVPGELTAELGRSLKEQVRKTTGARYVVVGGLADEWISYMLSPEEYRKGGYESSVSFYGAELGPTVVRAAVQGASRLPER